MGLEASVGSTAGQVGCTATSSYSVYVPFVEDTYYENNQQVYYVKYINQSATVSSSGVVTSFVDTYDSFSEPWVHKNPDFTIITATKKARLKCSAWGFHPDFPCLTGKVTVGSALIVSPPDLYFGVND